MGIGNHGTMLFNVPPVTRQYKDSPRDAIVAGLEQVLADPFGGQLRQAPRKTAHPVFRSSWRRRSTTESQRTFHRGDVLLDYLKPALSTPAESTLVSFGYLISNHWSTVTERRFLGRGRNSSMKNAAPSHVVSFLPSVSCWRLPAPHKEM